MLDRSKAIPVLTISFLFSILAAGVFAQDLKDDPASTVDEKDPFSDIGFVEIQEEAGLTPDDFFIRSFFLANLPYAGGYSGVPGRRITVINPDPAVRGNYSFLVGQQNVEFLCEPFSAHHLSRFVGD